MTLTPTLSRRTGRGGKRIHRFAHNLPMNALLAPSAAGNFSCPIKMRLTLAPRLVPCALRGVSWMLRCEWTRIDPLITTQKLSAGFATGESTLSESAGAAFED